MNKTGIVINIEKRKACIMTEDGQFLNVVVTGKAPSIGEVYSAPTAVPAFSLKRAASAAALIFIILTGSLAYTYNAEAASIVFDGNPEIRLAVNRWNMIIKAEALNEDGKEVLSSINIKNKSLNAGLDTIVDEAKKKNLIGQGNNDSSDKKDDINILVNNSKDKMIPDISEFKNHMKESNLNVVVGTEREKKSDNYYKQKDSKNSSNEINNSNQDTQVINPGNGNESSKNHNSNENNTNIKKNNNREAVVSGNKPAADNKDGSVENNGKSSDNKDKSKGNGESKKEGKDKGNH